jgi:hypothetical protein
VAEETAEPEPVGPIVAEPLPVAQVVAEPEPVVEEVAEPEPVAEPDIGPEPQPHMQPEPVAEPEPEPEPDTEPLREPAPGPVRDEPDTAPLPEPTPLPEPSARPSAARRAPRQRRASAVVAAFVAAIAAAAGFILAPGSGSAPATPLALSQTASTGQFSLSYPSAWQPALAPSTLQLSSRIALVPRAGGGGALIVGVATATDPTLLPKGFGATLLSPPQGAAVKLGSMIYRRYLNLLPRNATAPETVYALPTTAGTVTAACVAPTTNATEFAAACERVIASLRLRSGQALPLTASPAFAKSLASVIETLNNARASDGHQLVAAKRPADQAVAARRLASAHAAAAAAAGRLAPGPIGADASVGIVAALNELSSAYSSLATAAQHNDKGKYAAASSAITRGDASLEAGIAQLRQDGYEIS